MKHLSKIIVLICLFLGNCVSAEQFKVLVLPVDLFSVCENYYCFPEASEIFATDIINSFNNSGKISSPNLYEIRKKISETPQLKNTVSIALNQYKNKNSVDFVSLKKISNTFSIKSILLISSSVSKRSIWEVLEVSSAFEAEKQYQLETNAVLTDNVNDIVMWSGKWNRNLGDNESRFWATTAAQANSQLEKIKFYSQNLIAKNISQNVILRFYQKVSKPVTPQATPKTETTDFRPFNTVKQPVKEEYGEIESETIFNF